MSPEIASMPVEQPAEVSRRTLLRTVLGVGAVITVPGLAACGDDKPYELPSGGHPSVYPPSETPEQNDPRTPDTLPSADVADAQAPEATPTVERIKPEIAGHELDDLRHITWRSVENPDLADKIRNNGRAVKGDPESTGTDPDYYNQAVVLGVPADRAKNRVVRLVVALQDPSQQAGDSVAYVTLPKGTVNAGGERVGLMPTPTTSAVVHPYRVRLSPENVSMAFMTSADGKNWKMVQPHIITPSATVGNGTYSNAHLLQVQPLLLH